MLRSLAINICEYLHHHTLGKRITWTITWCTSAPLETEEIKRISQGNRHLLPHLLLFFVCFLKRNHYFYFGWQLWWQYTPCLTISNPPENFSRQTSTESFSTSLALFPKDVATEKSFTSLLGFAQMFNTCLLPYGLVSTGLQARNFQDPSFQLLLILALVAFQNLAPEASQLSPEKKKGPSLKITVRASLCLPWKLTCWTADGTNTC